MDEAPQIAPPKEDDPLRVARYRALHDRCRECGQRAWITGLVLVPASLASLAGLTRITCPAPMDFIILSGISTMLMSMWIVLAGRFRAQEEAALAEIAAMEGREPEPAALFRGHAVRAAVTLLLMGLFTVAWYIRPACESDTPPEDPELTRRL